MWKNVLIYEVNKKRKLTIIHTHYESIVKVYMPCILYNIYDTWYTYIYTSMGIKTYKKS